MRLLDTIKKASDRLETSGIEDPLVDAEMLVLHASGMDRLRAFIENPEVDRRLLARINRLIQRRSGGEPLQYIIGHLDFLGLEIWIGKGVLIPRPETELLVEEVIKTARSLKSEGRSIKPAGGKTQNVKSYSPLCMLDLCTGSGCIALALAREFPDARIIGTDISGSAITYAKRNAKLNGIGNVSFLRGSLYDPLKDSVRFDLVASNPPYIRRGDIAGLQREIREWEPATALDGGEDGLDFYRTILSGARGYLNPGGSVLLELGYGQAEEVSALAARSGFGRIDLIKDFAGIDRVLKASESVS